MYNVSDYNFRKGNMREELRVASDEEKIAFINEVFDNAYSNAVMATKDYRDAIESGEIKRTTWGSPNANSLKKWSNTYNKTHEFKISYNEYHKTLNINPIKKSRYFPCGRTEFDRYDNLLDSLLNEAINEAEAMERKHAMTHDDTTITINKIRDIAYRCGLGIDVSISSSDVAPERHMPDGTLVPLTMLQMKYLIQRYEEKEKLISEFDKETASGIDNI